MPRIQKIVTAIAGPLLVVVVLAALWAMRDSLFPRSAPNEASEQTAADASQKLEVLELGPQARKNLQLTVHPARPRTYWRTLTIPGVVRDRPGVSDRGVTSPAVGVIAEIHVYPGDTVRPGQRLVTVQLFSEYLQSTQTELFTASEEIVLLRKELDRLSGVASTGGISKSRLIELSNEVRRQETIVRASKQELLNRGLAPEQVEQITSGNFVSRIEVVAPPPRQIQSPSKSQSASTTRSTLTTRSPVTQARYMLEDSPSTEAIAYEVQELAIELGQTVQAGQRIVDLANHRYLYVVGHAFKREAGWLEQAAQEGREIEIEFADDSAEHWPPAKQDFKIRYLSNSIDSQTRTFDVFVPLENQARSYEKGGETFLVWRYRPGQRTRIEVPIERLDNVFVLPSEAVAREGPETFVYRQNGDLFNQIAVHVVHEDRTHAIIANDGSITPGTYIAQNAAASLRRVLKSQSASGLQPGFHVHADGTVHAAH